MTPAERRDPNILNGSRRARIANGSGTSVSAVNGLVQRFEQAAKMMKRMSNRGGSPLAPPGFGSTMGAGKKSGKKNKRKGSKSGNPMKREEEERALRERLSSGTAKGSSFAKKPQNPTLPPDLAGGLPGLFGR